MILPYQNKLVQIQFFQRSFTKVDNNTLVPTLIIHFEYLDSWEDAKFLRTAGLAINFFFLSEQYKTTEIWC